MNLWLNKILWTIAGLAALAGGNAFGADTWCIEDPANPPCGGAPGKCTFNKDYSYGGFVADTAIVAKTRWGKTRNKPFISQYAQVCDLAIITGQPRIMDKARVLGNARVFGNALVSGNARICESAKVSGNARVFGEAQVYGVSHVFGGAQVSGNSRIYGEAWVFANAWILENAQVYGTSHISGNTRVLGNAGIFGNVQFSEDDQIEGDTQVSIGPRVSRRSRVTFVLRNSLGQQISPSSIVSTPLSKEELEKLKKAREKLKETNLKLALQKIKEDHDTYLVSSPKREELKKDSRNSEIEIADLDKDLEACPLCLNTLQQQKNLVFTKCGHFICKPCFDSSKRLLKLCPMCRRNDFKETTLEIQYPSVTDQIPDALPPT
ncbi:MAG: RING finger family 4 domain-containing protein [Bdellovibrionia bacterium]